MPNDKGKGVDRSAATSRRPSAFPTWEEYQNKGLKDTQQSEDEETSSDSDVWPEPIYPSPSVPDIVINAPPEDDLPSYRVDLQPPTQRKGPHVLVRPPEGSLLPSIWVRYPGPVEEAPPEFPVPHEYRWRPAMEPPRPQRDLGTWFWPPPTGDPRHSDSLLNIPTTKT